MIFFHSGRHSAPCGPLPWAACRPGDPARVGPKAAIFVGSVMVCHQAPGDVPCPWCNLGLPHNAPMTDVWMRVQAMQKDEQCSKERWGQAMLAAATLAFQFGEDLGVVTPYDAIEWLMVQPPHDDHVGAVMVSASTSARSATTTSSVAVAPPTTPPGGSDMMHG